MKETAITLVLIAAAPGCLVGSDSNPPLSYDEFVARYVAVAVDPATGAEHLYYDWDQPLASRDQVKQLHAAYVAAKTGGETVSEATVNLTLFGRDVWAPGDRALTYCVSNAFGANKTKVVTAMATAATAWQTATAGVVTFTYHGELDASCTTSAPVAFDVIPVDDPSGVIAQAFFPSFARENRQVFVNVRNAFTPAPLFPFEGVLRHELGHVLGLRHETARGEAIARYGWQCFEDVFFQPLTTYDQQSVMVTPACVGKDITNPTLSLSAGDVTGIRALYR